MPAVFIVAAAVAFALRKRGEKTLDAFAAGMGHRDVMVMCLVFILAGVFASLAKASGAVEAMVRLSHFILPERFALAGVFAISCLVSLAMGTSCGTISAVGPVAFQLAADSGVSLGAMAGAVVGGAMFGDNLSVVSDTTIAATRTQGVEMREKFLANVQFAIPAALATLAIYAFRGGGTVAVPQSLEIPQILLVLPYVFVLLAAVAGLDVIAVLLLGSLFSAAAGIACGTLAPGEAASVASAGAVSMSETLIVALLAGGIFALVRLRGGMEAISAAARRLVRGPKTCEIAVCLLCGAVNVCTANNTVAIVVAGPVAAEWRRIAGASPRRIAGILDAASCVVQGAIPYGAQILIALGVARTFDSAFSAWGIMTNLVYQAALAVALAAWILAGRKR